MEEEIQYVTPQERFLKAACAANTQLIKEIYTCDCLHNVPPSTLNLPISDMQHRQEATVKPWDLSGDATYDKFLTKHNERKRQKHLQRSSGGELKG